MSANIKKNQNRKQRVSHVQYKYLNVNHVLFKKEEGIIRITISLPDAVNTIDFRIYLASN